MVEFEEILLDLLVLLLVLIREENPDEKVSFKSSSLYGRIDLFVFVFSCRHGNN